MSAGYLLGLDAGGGSGRALLVDVETGPVASARRPWMHPAAPGTFGLGVDLDLDGVWARLADAAREVLARAKVRPEQVLGVAATGMRFACVVLDGEGRALLAASNRDGRATGAALELAARHGTALQARTGHWPSPITALVRLRWLAREHPALFARAAHLLAISDWLAWRLCGAIASEPTQASTTGLFDVSARGWASDLAEDLSLPSALLPALVATGARVGALGDEAARAFGLRAGTPVAAGGADTQCGLLGMAALRPGDAGMVTGTSAPLQLVVDRPLVDAETRSWTECHVVPGRWVLECNAGPLGESLAWTAELLFAGAVDPVARLCAEAARSQPGAAGLLATFGTPVSNGRTLALPVASLCFSPLLAADGGDRRRHMARAALEGAAFALRANLEQLAAVSGAPPSSLATGGGLAQSATWLRIVTDIFGRPLGVAPTPESSALGAALCAGVGAGVWPDLDAAAGALLPVLRRVEPDPEHVPLYEHLHPIWLRHAAARAPADAPASEHMLPEVLRARGAELSAAGASTQPRMLVTADLDDDSLARLREIGPVEHAPFREAMRLLAGPALVEALEGVEVFVTEVDVIDAAALAKLPALRAIATCRGDAVNVDIDACSAFGVPVLHAPGRNAEAVADLAVGFALMLLRKLPEAAGFLRQPGIEPGDLGRMGQAFGRLRGRELGGKTVGLIGLGAVGRAVARRLRGFGARVLVADPFVGAEQAALSDAALVPLDELLARSDVVSLHAPVTDATRGMLGMRELSLLKPGALLINTARAALVDEQALLVGLGSGHIGGAAIDVFEIEPPGSDHPLLRFDNVIATPHVGGNTAEIGGHQGRIVAADLARLVRGERPHHVLNPAVLAHFDWRAPRPEPDRVTLAALAGRAGPAVSDLQRDAKRTRPSPPGQDSRPRYPLQAAEGGAQRGEAERSSSGRATAQQPDRPEVDPKILDTMQRILASFVARVVADEQLQRFAADRDVTLHFTLNDLGLSFWLRLRGALAGALGAPDARPEVDLKLRADVLDGMFTGRVNPMQAAMNGRLSFTGDAAKAMTLQQLQPDLARHYRAAREEIGDPGDLTALAEPSGAAAAKPAPAGAGDLRAELCRVVGELYAQELITATGGNVSARSPGSSEVWITPSQLFKGDLRPEILVRVDLDGQPLDAGAASPSSERLMHCAVYRARPEAMAVVHAHAPHATILANAGLPFLPVSTEAAFFGNIPRVPFIMPGTEALAKAVEQAARESWAVLLVNHGLLVGGRSLRRAADMVEIVERSAEVILGCYAVGKEPPTLPDDVVAQLRSMGDLVA